MALQLYTGVATAAGATIAVRLTGLLNLATIYLDPLFSPLGNPFTADQATGAWLFYADDLATYDVVEVGVTPPPTAEISLILVASGVSPARVDSLYIVDQGNQILLATTGPY